MVIDVYIGDIVHAQLLSITTIRIALAIQIILLIIFLLSGNFCFLLLYFTNSVDQGQHGPDLDPNYLAL